MSISSIFFVFTVYLIPGILLATLLGGWFADSRDIADSELSPTSVFVTRSSAELGTDAGPPAHLQDGLGAAA